MPALRCPFHIQDGGGLERDVGESGRDKECLIKGKESGWLGKEGGSQMRCGDDS